ncbi:AAA family ATPase [Arthrobacter sp. MSA 4-2]|uniref:helix-turn-helix transcriptional regulator n=1 Tax=Arthrobacter sp. MSA 4-2 TaxID=2794349 RepID=UPI0018E78437|nr:LuxR family transcriptional regulator [Arthrobacter sp. MSA 4-2]MBJ2121501.1 AAA family ATPase [Arthrobacter sp. MSA 4-2]
MPNLKSRPGLVGRQRESAQFSKLLAIARAGRGGVLVLRGEAGIGKSALLDDFCERATDFLVARLAGVESEMDLAYSGLHQLCIPFLGHLNRLPAPQQAALESAFGLRSGSAPDRFLVGLAVLTLLSEAAEKRPLACCSDDVHWLDAASAQALEFVARRLATGPVAMVFAVRDPTDRPGLLGLPELTIEGLDSADAAVLLDTVVSGPMDPRVRDRIVAESRGNPLALVELPRGCTGAELTFWHDRSHSTTPRSQRLERGFLRRVQPLPPQTQQLLLTAATEPLGDVRLLLRAAERLRIGADAVMATEADGLIALGDGVRFRHPLVRSAVYHAASPGQRRKAHQVLADVTDPEVDPDRRAWHRACAAVGPDDAVASDLEGLAGRAQLHGGLAARAMFLERSAALTVDRAQRVRRCLNAAQAKVQAGQFEDVPSLLGAAEQGPLAEGERAKVDLMRGKCLFAGSHGNTALPLLMTAARRLEPLDTRLARDAYLEALTIALYLGRLASGPGTREVAEAIRGAQSPKAPYKRDALLDALAVRFTEGYPPAVALSHRAVHAFASEELTLDEALGFASIAAATAASLWDDVDWDVLSCRYLQIARDTGVPSALHPALVTRILVHLFTGDLAAAASLVDEMQSVSEVVKSTLAPYGEVGLLAMRGHPELAEPPMRDWLDHLRTRGEGVGLSMASWARAVLCNGLGRYREALQAAREAAENPLELGPPQWALAEVVEAGVRSGEISVAEVGLERLSMMACASGTDWALGVEASRRALLQEGAAAENLYREGIERLTQTRMRVELARVRLLYGEWLRREGRRGDARSPLRTAHEAFGEMGMDAFAGRARRELLATGEKVPKRTAEASAKLTPQEAAIARLAAQGLTNSQIGAALFISPKTVEWHLRNIFVRLGITCRAELRSSLPTVYRPAP